MLSKNEIIALIVTFLVLFGLGGLIYTPWVQSQLTKETRAQLDADTEKRFGNLEVKFRGQDAYLTGTADSQEDVNDAIKVVRDTNKQILFRKSGNGAVRKVHSNVDVETVASTAKAPENLEPGSEPFVTVAAYGDKVLRVDGLVGSAGVKVQLKESLHRRYPGYRVDDKNVKTSFRCSPPRNGRDVNSLPILKSNKDSFFAAGKLDGSWKVFDGKSVARGPVEQVLSSSFPAHEHPMGGLQALIDWRKKPTLVASNPRDLPKRTATTTNPRVTRASIPPKTATTTTVKPVPTPRTIRPNVATPAPTPPTPPRNVVNRNPRVNVPALPKPPAIDVVPLESNAPFKPFPADTAVPSTPIPARTVKPKPPTPVDIVRNVPKAPTVPKVVPKPPVRVNPATTRVPPTRIPPTRTITPKPKPVVAAPKARPLGRLTFDTGASSLSNEQKTYGLRLVKRIIASRPNATFEVVGHTDSQGAEASNLAMSRKRAEAVKTFLVSSGVPTGKVTVVGKGESTPIADNNTADGRRQNRRVEIIATF